MCNLKNFPVLYVCLIFNYTYCEKYSNFFNIGEDGDEISENCITKIIRNNIRCGNMITVVTEINVDVLLEAISNDECYSVITRTFYSQEWLVRNEYVVVLAKDIFGLESGIMDFTNDLIWNSNAKYIIQVANIRTGQDIAEVLLRHNIFSAVFVDISRKSDRRIYTYYPFKYRNCAGDHNTVVTLGLCKDNVTVANIFSEKLPDKFNKCIIRVARHEDIPHVILESSNYTLRGNRLPGLEEYILESIGTNKGYLIDYIQTGNDTVHGIVLDNGTVTGVLNYLETGEADISIGGYVLILNRARIFDYIWGHYFGGLNIFTATKSVNRWKLVYKEFSWLTWIIIGAFYCLFVAVLNIYNITAAFFKDRILLILKLWGYFYGNTSNTLYKEKKIRGVLMCWIWFTFFISSFYNTAFYTLTTVQNSHIHRVHKEKFDMSIYKPCISDSMRTLSNYAIKMTWAKNAFTACDKVEDSLQIVSSRNDLFSVEMKYTYAMNEQKYTDEEGNHMLEVWEFTKGATVTTMYTARGFPLKDTIQAATRTMAETGLLQAHLYNIQLRTIKAVHAKQKAFRNLDMRSISVAFGLLFSGLLIALIVFALEVGCKKSELVIKAIEKLNEIKIVVGIKRSETNTAIT